MAAPISQKNGFFQAVFSGAISGGINGCIAGALVSIPVAGYIFVFADSFARRGRPGIRSLEFALIVPPRAVILGAGIGAAVGATGRVTSHIFSRIINE